MTGRVPPFFNEATNGRDEEDVNAINEVVLLAVRNKSSKEV